VFAVAPDGRLAREYRYGILEVRGRVGAAAVLASVAVLVLGAADGAGAAHEAVGQEHLFLLVVGLVDRLRVDVAGVGQRAVDAVDELAVLVGVGRVEVIEHDAEVSEVRDVRLLVVRDDGFRRHAVLSRADHDRCAVRVAGADEIDLVALQALETHPDVGLDVLDEMAQVDVAVGVRQGAGYEKAAWRGGHGSVGSLDSPHYATRYATACP